MWNLCMNDCGCSGEFQKNSEGGKIQENWEHHKLNLMGSALEDSLLLESFKIINAISDNGRGGWGGGHEN